VQHHISSQKCLWNESLPLAENFLILSQLFSEIMQEKYNIKVPSDFLKLAAAAMVHLQDCNRTNIIGASLSEPHRMVVFMRSTVRPFPKIYVANLETPPLVV